MKEFISEYASVTYSEEDKVVCLVWKKPAYLDNYREPAMFALELLRGHSGSNFVVDARKGFEDDKRDVEWGFNYLLPEMAKTSCRFFSFIMNEVNAIEEEMDMWTLEAGKYFAVTRAEDYEGALRSMRECMLVNVVYVIKDGKREEFIEKFLTEKIAHKSRQEPGNLKYEISLSVECENEVFLTEIWTNEMEQKRHAKTPHYATLTELKKSYVTEVSIRKDKVVTKVLI